MKSWRRRFQELWMSSDQKPVGKDKRYIEKQNRQEVKREISKLLRERKKMPKDKETSGSILTVVSLSETADKYLTDKAKVELNNPALQVTVKVGNDWWTAVYLSVRVRRGNEEKGVKAVSAVVNELSKDGLIHSCLAKM